MLGTGGRRGRGAVGRIARRGAVGGGWRQRARMRAASRWLWRPRRARRGRRAHLAASKPQKRANGRELTVVELARPTLGCRSSVMTDAAASASASTPPTTPDAFLAKLSVAESKPSEVEDPPGCTTVRRLGSGSAGTIYLMRRDDGLLCVSKRVPVSHLSHADQEKAEREVNILATLEHPHIVRYDRAFVRMGQLCIVMEHAAGGDLASHVASLRRDGGRRVAVERAAEWFVQLLLAPSSTCTPIQGAPPRRLAEEHLPLQRPEHQARRLRRGVRARRHQRAGDDQGRDAVLHLARALRGCAPRNSAQFCAIRRNSAQFCMRNSERWSPCAPQGGRTRTRRTCGPRAASSSSC